jgi:hypothetical protein
MSYQKISLKQRINKATSYLTATFSGIKDRFLQLGPGTSTPPPADK